MMTFTPHDRYSKNLIGAATWLPTSFFLIRNPYSNLLSVVGICFLSVILYISIFFSSPIISRTFFLASSVFRVIIWKIELSVLSLTYNFRISSKHCHTDNPPIYTKELGRRSTFSILVFANSDKHGTTIDLVLTPYLFS